LNRNGCSRKPAAFQNSRFFIKRKKVAPRWDVAVTIISPNPETAPAPKNKKDRTLSDKEIRALWAERDYVDMSDEIRRALKCGADLY
jgi:hypothetical protein